MDKKSSFSLKASIFAIAFVATSNTIASVLLADVSKAFPEASMTAIQMIMTLGMIGAFPITFLVGFLANKIRKKPMIILGLAMIALGGVLPIVIRGNLNILYASALIVGAGQGFLGPLLGTIIIESFSGEERNSMLGLNTSLQNAGAMILLVLAGMIAKSGWINVYYLYFISVIALILAAAFLPKGEVPAAQNIPGKNNKVPVPSKVIITSFFSFLFFMGYVTFAISISLFLAATGLGDATTTSLAMTLNTGLGVVAGIVFGRIIKYVKLYITVVSGICAIIGFACVYFATSVLLVYIGAIFLGLTFGLSGAGGGYIMSRITTPEQVAPSFSLMMTFVTAGVIAAPLVVNSVTKIWAGADSTPKDVFLTALVIVTVMTVVNFFWSAYLTRTAYPEKVPEQLSA